MNLISRDHCVFSDSTQKELLHTFKHFPVRMGCTEQPESEDLYADMSWWIFPKTGSIQLNPLLPPEVLYGVPHNEAIGGIWQQHHRELAEFVAKFSGQSILELGGATGLLAGNVLGLKPELKWTLLEPNPLLNEELAKKVHVIKDFVRDDADLSGEWDTIVHSHFFEHFYEPRKFLYQVNRALPTGGWHVFSMPNMRSLLKNCFSNCLNFEHTCFLDESFVEWMLESAGFRVKEKKYFRDHSIFFATQRSEPNPSVTCPSLYAENKALFQHFLDYNFDSVARINQKISETPDGPIYLFGAHIFSQFLIGFGLDTSKVVSLLDSSPTKQGKRLSGTNLKVEAPSALRGLEKAHVILKAANYNEEIKATILGSHNSNVEFWE